MSAANPFKKATKAQLKARVALDGPSGAGKTWTSLEWAGVLAEGGTIAVIDTEHGSASLYADRFDFDVLVWDPPYDPGKLADTIKQAQGVGYAVLVIDSLSHFWEGEGGTRDMVDAAAEKAKGNSFAGWKVGTPALRHLIDVMLGCDMHVVATMRTKTEWILETNTQGKQVPRRIGMAPVMRQGVEYEFTLIGDMDLEHRIVFSKSRCPDLADTLVQPGRATDSAETFLRWLNAGEKLASAAVVADIKQRLNALDGESRKQFKAHLGHPDRLLADDVENAQTMVARFEAEAANKTSTPEGSGDRVAGDVAPDSVLAQAEGTDDRDVDTGNGGQAPVPNADEPPISQIQNKRLHALLNKTHPGQDRHEVLSQILGRKVESAKELTESEANRVIDSLDAEQRAARGAAS